MKRYIKNSVDDIDSQIVIYVNGKKIYEGDIYDTGCRDAFEKICKMKGGYDELVDYCNSFGDPIIEDGESAFDVAADTWQMVIYNFEDYDSVVLNEYENYYEDFMEGYSPGAPRIEMFLARADADEMQRW